MGPKYLHRVLASAYVTPSLPPWQQGSDCFHEGLCCLAPTGSELVAQDWLHLHRSSMQAKGQICLLSFLHRCSVSPSLSQGPHLTRRYSVATRISRFNTRVPGCWQDITALEGKPFSSRLCLQPRSAVSIQKNAYTPSPWAPLSFLSIPFFLYWRHIAFYKSESYQRQVIESSHRQGRNCPLNRIKQT